MSSRHAPITALKDVDSEDVVEVQALDEEPMKHRRAAVLQQDVEALAEVRLQTYIRTPR